MKHLTEQQLVALAMGHGTAEAARHAASCTACQAQRSEWQNTLHTAQAWPVPAAPDPDRLWQRIAPRLDDPPQRRRFTHPFAPAWAMAAVVCIALGGFWLTRPRPRNQSALAPRQSMVQQPSRVLRFAVAQHLDRTQVLLVEMAHANELPGPAVNLSLEKSSARQLLNANRLYHQSASLQGDAMMAHVLSSLEPPLLELAHSPNEVPPAAWRTMQRRIAHSGVLFKVRVLDQTLHAQHGAL